MEKHHYLGCPDARKRHLGQVACYEGKSGGTGHLDDRLGQAGRSRSVSALGCTHTSEAAKPTTPRVVPPPGEGCWRNVLATAEPEELAKALNRWLQAQSKQGTLPELLSIDGKVIGNNLATLVSLVDAHDGSPVAQEAAPGNGQEQKLTKRLVEALPESALEGKTVKGDALYSYSNKSLVREIKGNLTLSSAL